jgi:hypothetical protein
MNSDSFSIQIRNSKSGISIRQTLLSEIQRAKERMISTPQPFCELDCPWLIFCKKFQLSGCILSDLIESNLLRNITFNSTVKEENIIR